ncbi:MAG: hypothetical protein C5B52_16000 [Bacteroidetes bacterium]|nr:MAG: hypothetical protein C5B52_16000 [Bacteroidota bacterium]
MKKCLFNLAGMLPAMLAATLTFAQGNSVAPNFDASKSLAPAPAMSNAHARALKDFNRNNKTAPAAQWRQIQDGFIAEFTQDGIQSRTAYDKKGNFVYTIKTYGEKDLPKEVRKQVKSTYYDFSITQVEEVHASDKVAYLVHIQDGNAWKIIRVTEDDMDVYKEGQNL